MHYKRIVAVALGAIAIFSSGIALAQSSYPERPIQMIVPWGAGGGTDAVAASSPRFLEGTRQAGQRREPHGRLGRRRPQRHRQCRTRRLHDRHHDDRDRHDALAGSDRADLRGLRHPRHGQLRSGRRDGLGRIADTTTAKELLAAIKSEAEGHLQGVGYRPGRHLASRPRRLAAVEGCRRPGDLGAEPGRGTRHHRHGRRRRRHRAVLAGRRPLDDRRRARPSAGLHVGGAPGTVPGRADPEGGGRFRLDPRRLAAVVAPEGPAGRRQGAS